MTLLRNFPAFALLRLALIAAISCASVGCGSGSGDGVTKVVEKPEGYSKASEIDVPLKNVKKKP